MPGQGTCGRVDAPPLEEARARRRDAGWRDRRLRPDSRDRDGRDRRGGLRAIRIDGLAAARSFGAMEGLARDEMPVRFPQAIHEPAGHARYSLAPPRGEPYDDPTRGDNTSRDRPDTPLALGMTGAAVVATIPRRRG